MFWTPAFAGVTTKETFYEFVKVKSLRFKVDELVKSHQG